MPETFTSFGVPVQLTLEGPGLDERVLDILPPGWRASRPTATAAQFGLRQIGAGAYELRLNGDTLLQHVGLDLALGALDARIRLHIAANASGWTFVHAGVVAYAGRALILPGESFAGKTTLVKTLVEAGATYYSDEYAVLDHDGRVHPYPRRLSLRGATDTEERHVSELGGVAGVDPAEVALVALITYVPDAVWQPRRLSAGQGVAAVLTHAIPAHDRPRQSLRAVSRAVSGAQVLEGDRGEAGAAAAALLRELGAPATGPA